MMETTPKRGVSRVRRDPSGTRYRFPRRGYKGTDEYQDQRQALKEPMSTKTKNSQKDDPMISESRNSGIDIILSNPRPHRVSFLCESATNSSAPCESAALICSGMTPKSQRNGVKLL
ncbi:hypothetical protein Taro_033258 [Colocasia esculenta]|uniref:Uncharacterized protein n=1 Tax=Colocasia esculenta TaxID=4460 RepID=A0A843W8J4_COLES|nr:hypothetical protein [Colocasia esculenta]